MKNNVSKLVALVGVFMLVACAGCGGRVQVKGTVKFSDGTPLSYGTVNFTNDTTMCKGQIEKDGSFTMRTFKPGDGVPPGTYKVYITDTLQFGESGAKVKTGDVEMELIGKSSNTVPYEYADPDKSPLGTITVSKSMNQDFVIEGSSPETKPGDETK